MDPVGLHYPFTNCESVQRIILRFINTFIVIISLC